jgi:hypothetical protein
MMSNDLLITPKIISPDVLSFRTTRTIEGTYVEGGVSVAVYGDEVGFTGAGAAINTASGIQARGPTDATGWTAICVQYAEGFNTANVILNVELIMHLEAIPVTSNSASFLNSESAIGMYAPGAFEMAASETVRRPPAMLMDATRVHKIFRQIQEAVQSKTGKRIRQAVVPYLKQAGQFVGRRYGVPLAIKGLSALDRAVASKLGLPINRGKVIGRLKGR